MANDRAALDAVLASLVTNIGNLTTALASLATAIANLPKPGSEDFTPEIGQVQSSMDAVTAANTSVQNDLTALNPPPPPTPNP